MTRAGGGDRGERTRRRPGRVDGDGPRFVPSDLTPKERRVYLGATAVLVLVFVALVWPVYPLFADIRPFVLGMPLSLVWVVAWLFVSFFTLLAVYLWEDRREEDD